MARVLIVDESKESRDALAMIVGIAGHTTDAASSVAAAERRLAREGYDVVLIDILMPTMDGLELIRHCRRAYPDLKLVAYTSSPPQPTPAGEHDVLEDARRFGADATFRKPVSASELVAIIGRLAP